MSIFDEVDVILFVNETLSSIPFLLILVVLGEIIYDLML